MSKNKILTFVCCILFTTIHIAAQSSSGSIKGTVVDADSNEELVGASINIKSIKRSGVTDENGRFTFGSVPEGKHSLQVSFMGYKTQAESIELSKNESKQIIIKLQRDENSLDELTVTAKSEARRLKEDGMPVTVINVSSLQGTVTSISDILSKTVGMTVRTSGGVGSASRISVRGLEGKRIGFFIDEIPMNDQSDFLDLNDIPVDMIERIEIYKGVVPARFGGSSMGGAVNIKIKEYPDKYMDVSYMRESFNSNKLQMVTKRNLKEQGLLFGVGGGYTYADNDYSMIRPHVQSEDLKIKRDHDRFKKIMVGGSFKATKWWFDEIEFEPVFIDTKKQIQGIETDIRKAETKSRAYLLANTLKKEDFFLSGLDLDFSTAAAFTSINLIDTAKVRYGWDGEVLSTPSKYGGEMGNQYASNSDDRKFTLINKLNLEYLINRSHSINFNSLFNLVNGYPEDSLRDLSLNKKSVFDSKMRSWVGGLNYDFRTRDDKFLNSVTARYYIYSMKTQKAQIYGGNTPKDISLSKNAVGFSNAMRYRLRRDFLTKFSIGYDVRIPSETELLGDGYAISPSESLLPERNFSINLGFLYDRLGLSADNMQIELSFFYGHLKDMIRFAKTFDSAQYQNFGEMRTLGAEFDLKMDLFPWLYGYFNVTFQDLRDVRKYEEGGTLDNPTYKKRMPNTPYLMSNAGLEFHKENLFGGEGQNTRIFTDASFIEEYFYDFEVSGGSQRRIPRSLAIDLGVEHSLLHNRLYLSGKIKNVTNRTLLTEFNFPLPSRSVGFKVRYIFK